ncbi:hypothetical protein J4436_03720 [Candidatus Woesearchaeota archaeon]|nr:hypothetical protein [Candidatus Woesearchaeota archaeon]
MKEIIIICLLFISSCVTPSEDLNLVPPIAEPKSDFVCNEPYIQVGSECCLDQNKNKICDRDEIIEEENNIVECNLINPFTCRYAKIEDNKIIISLKFLNPEIAFIKTISFPSLDCTVHFNAPESEWIKDPLTDYSYILPLKETELEIPCEITEDYVNTDWEISYIIYDDGVPYNDGLRYLYDKEDKTYGTLLAEL